MAEGGGGSPSQEGGSHSAAVGSDAVVVGQTDQRGCGGQQGAGQVGDGGGALHHTLHHWSLGN